jgi:hypothetical protein
MRLDYNYRLLYTYSIYCIVQVQHYSVADQEDLSFDFSNPPSPDPDLENNHC